jgi:hypothetical protein
VRFVFEQVDVIYIYNTILYASLCRLCIHVANIRFLTHDKLVNAAFTSSSRPARAGTAARHALPAPTAPTAAVRHLPAPVWHVRRAARRWWQQAPTPTVSACRCGSYGT